MTADVLNFFETVDEFNLYTQDGYCSKSFFLLHQNIRSISRNIDAFAVYLNTMVVKPDIIILTEAWIREGDNAEYFTLGGYHMLSVASRERCGGIVVYYAENRDITCQLNDSTIPGADSALLDFKFEKLCFTLLAIYRFHRYSKDDFLDGFQQCISNISSNTLICVGDFNIDVHSSNMITDKYIEIASSHGLENLINVATRVVGASSSCIDHILYRSSRCFDERSVVLNSQITDHRAVGLFIPVADISNSKFVLNSRAKLNYSLMNQMLQIEKWESVYTSSTVDKAFESFLYILNNIISNSKEDVLTVNSSKRLKKIKPWINNGLILAFKNREKMWKKLLRSPGDVLLRQRYNIFRQNVQRWVKNAKFKFYNTQLSKLKNNQKAQWKIINELSGRGKKKSPPINLKIGNTLVSNPKSVAEEFNNYFVNVPASLASSNNSVHPEQESEYNKTFKHANIPNSLFFSPVTEDELNKLIQSLEGGKSPGADEITAGLVKNICKFICPVLVFIFNKSLVDGTFPQTLKVARVVPIFKKGSVTSIGNYRPISLLSVFSKILEKLVKSRLIDFLTSNSFLNNSQFGFRKGLNTEMALHNFISQIHNNLNNMSTKKASGFFLDLRKAFDTVNHKRLLRKLEWAGIRGCALDWFTSYLSNRKQYVVVDNQKSSVQSVCCGVPQGSVLGPVLFLIYINDLYAGPFRGRLTGFADDTALSYGASSIHSLKKDIEHDIKLLSLWFSCNKLSLNVDKSFIVNFSLSNSFRFNSPIQFHEYNCSMPECTCEALIESSSVKYLGLTVDENLSWKPHINNIKRFMFIFLRKFYYLRIHCPDNILYQLYYAFIHSRLSYGLSCWGSTYVTYINPLCRAQKPFIRMILKQPKLTESLPLFVQLKILPLRYLYVFKVLSLFFKVSGNPGPGTYQRTVKITRQVDHLKLPKANSTFYQKTFLFLGPKFCNFLPDNVRNSWSKPSFKNLMKYWLLSKTNYEIEQLFHVQQ